LGYSQVPGIGFSDNNLPQVNDVMLRMCLVNSLAHKLKAAFIDVETVSLHKASATLYLYF